MTTSPKVSILIPAFNSAAFIRETLQSALAQTWENTEIIVVDDGSTDETRDFVAEYRQQGVRLVHQDRQGAAAARNRAFVHSTGAFIQYLDADDLLSPEKIEFQLTDLLSRDPGTVASCEWARFNQDPSEAEFVRQKVWNSLSPIDWLVEAWEGGGMMQTACWLTPRHLIEQSKGWNETLVSNPNDDGEFFCRILTRSQAIIFNSDAKVYYRSNIGGSLSRQLSDSAISSLLATCDSYTKHALELEDTPRVRHACAMNYLTFIYRFYPSHMDLVQHARHRVKDLGIEKIEPVGGSRFKQVANLVGFDNALRLRALLKLPFRPNR